MAAYVGDRQRQEPVRGRNRGLDLLAARGLWRVLAVWLVGTVLSACSGPTQTPVSQPPTRPVATVVVATPTPIPTRPAPTFVPLITPSPTPDIVRLSPEQAWVLVEAGRAVIVDIRPQAQYESAHIAGSLSLPLEYLVKGPVDLPHQKRVIFYCA